MVSIDFFHRPTPSGLTPHIKTPTTQLQLFRPEGHIERIAGYFTDSFQNPVSARVFFKALVFYALIKTILIWPVGRSIISYHALSLPRSVLGKIFTAPAHLADKFPDAFFIAGVCFLVGTLVVRPNIILNALFFCFTFNLYLVGFPISDGSDIVLFMLSFWSILLVSADHPKSPMVQLLRITLFNLTLLFCQLQIVFVYALSGLDKVMSETWRTGVAFAYIEHLEFLYNPVLPGLFSSPFWQVVLSWATILFELLFVLLVWSNRMRIPMLVIGTVFHLFIGVVLNLPDFAAIMILSYLIFLRDADYSKIKSWIKPMLP